MPNDNRGPIATEGEYNGKPSLTLSWRADSPYPFSFGVTKARLILACLEQIKAFVAAHPEDGTGNRGKGRPAAQRQAPPDPPRREGYGHTSATGDLHGQPLQRPDTTQGRPDATGGRPC